ncbi:MAG: hypothetical protein J6A01_03715 [Proteobacteria bacterium]|nr:hypothetical protein [Pseudomonadota bacterium]
MSDEHPRKDYKASVEAGLHRLEQEKLSFLGASPVISKFDSRNLEVYAPSFDTEDETTVNDRDIMPSGSFDMMRTLSDVQQIGSDVLLEVDGTAEKTEMPTVDFGNEESEELSDINTMVSSNLFRHDRKQRHDTQSAVDYEAARREETSDNSFDSMDCKSSQDVSQFAEPDNWESAETNDLGRHAKRVRIVLAKDNDEDNVKTNDLGKDADRVRAAIVQRYAGDNAETNDLGKDADRVRAAINQRYAGDNVETNDLGKDADRVRSAFAQSYEGIDSEAETHDIGKLAERVRAAYYQGNGDNNSEDEDEQTLPSRDFLDYAETTDLGHQAELVRKALSQQRPDVPPPPPLPPIPASSSKPKAQILKPATGLPNTPVPAPAAAIDKLKQQGIFEPMTVHPAVSDCIRSIPALDNLLPQSSVQPWSGEFDSGDETVPHKQPTGGPVQEKVGGGPVVAPVAQPEVVSSPMAQKLSELDLESRETIPINLTDESLKAIAEEAALHRAKTTPITRRSVNIPIKAQTVVLETHPHRAMTLAWGITILVVLAAIVYVLFLSGVLGKLSPSLAPYKPTHAKVTASPVTVDPVKYRETIEQASQAIANTVDFESWLEPWIETRVNQQVSPEGRLPYLELAMSFYPDNPRHAQRYIESCIDAGQQEHARSVLQSLPETIQKNEALRDLKYRIWLSDTHFISPTATLNEEMCDAISPLGGGSTLTFKCDLKGETVAAFKPLQARKQSNYRSEIAAWRLCELIECDFAIPWNRPVRIERNLFNQLYNRSKSKKKDSYRKELIDITWTKDGDGSFVYGTLKDWVPNFTRFPIEYKTFWQPWLSQNNYIAEYKPLKEALSVLNKNPHTAKLLSSLLDQSPSVTTKQLAAQVSEVLVFDFLVGNWDRFSGVPDWWGVNCQYKDNRIVSIDNGAAFPTYSNDKVYERFMMAERFSAHFINALRDLDKEQTFKILFPSPSKHETESFEQFWRQRSQVLNRVDTLSEKYGVERVLSL